MEGAEWERAVDERWQSRRKITERVEGFSVDVVHLMWCSRGGSVDVVVVMFLFIVWYD